MKTYELPLTRSYVRNWTAVEAIRELLQNNIDFGKGKLTAEVGENSITISSPGAKLEPRTLLLGHTTKADDAESIGSFGEGYKIALLVLAREGISVEVWNGNLLWTPALRTSETFGEEVLFIDELYTRQDPDHLGVHFRISGLPSATVAKVVENTLQLQKDFGSFHRVSKGDILLERAGKLYVNGLFITDDTGLAYGYNIQPQFLKLERDRQTVSDFDLKWQTKDMWIEANLPTQVAAMMKEDVPDVAYIEHGHAMVVKEAAYRMFCDLHPGAVIAKSQAELETIMKDKLVKEVVVYSNSGFYNAVTSHPEYDAGAVKRVVLTPEGTLKAFLQEQRKNMNRKSIVAFNDIVVKAKDWK